MDQTNQTEMNTQNQVESTPNNTPNKTKPTVAILTVILVVVIAALYVFASRTDDSTIPTENEVATEIQTVTETSDNLSSIETDLNISTTGLDEQNF